MRRVLLVLMCIAACKRGGDEAARARIFSPEDSGAASSESKEPIDARKLDDPQVAQRVLHMSQGEAAQRLGAHRAEQRVQFAWFHGAGQADGGSEVSLAEETKLSQAANGDFSVALANDHNQGFELVWTNGQVFVKSLYGAFHERRTDRTDAPRVRDQALSGLASFDRLARGLKLRDAGEISYEGRRAERYTVVGSGGRSGKGDKSDLPKIEYPGGKADPDTARRLELWEKEEPQSVKGTLLVDTATGAPLTADLEGHFRVPGQSNAPAAELDLHTVLVVHGVGRAVAINAPKAEPEPSVPHAVKDPLRFLGRAPGVAPEAASSEEPEEQEQDEEEQQAPKPEPTH
jgi:hypothetical protein